MLAIKHLQFSEMEKQLMWRVYFCLGKDGYIRPWFRSQYFVSDTFLICVGKYINRYVYRNLTSFVISVCGLINTAC
jgi:hypothetical protein